MKIVHISANRRKNGCPGGVEKFGWYLERAVGAELLVPGEYHCQYDGNTLFVVDGGHGLNIPDAAPIVSVCHGTWVALWARWNFKEELGTPYEDSQVCMWGVKDKPGKPNVTIAACSSGAARELLQYHGRTSTLMLHGVDHDQYVPKQTTNAKPVIIHVGNEYRKGQHLIPEIAQLLPQFNFEYLNAKIGEEPTKFANGDMFIHISCSEGNSYACLEAMSCNLPMVVTNVGLFEADVDSSVVGKVIPFGSSVENIAASIAEVWETRQNYNPREWIEQHATFQKFKERWETLIDTF